MGPASCKVVIVGCGTGVLSGKKFFVHGTVRRLTYMSLHLPHRQNHCGMARTMLLALVCRGKPCVKLIEARRASLLHARRFFPAHRI